MALTDPLGDMLTRIRNGQQARKDSVMSPASKLRARVLITASSGSAAFSCAIWPTRA